MTLKKESHHVVKTGLRYLEVIEQRDNNDYFEELDCHVTQPGPDFYPNIFTSLGFD